MTSTDYRPPDVMPPHIAPRLERAAAQLDRINRQAKHSAPRLGRRSDVRSQLLSTAERLLLQIDSGRAEPAQATLVELERIARDAVAARLAEVAEPGAGGHRWYAPTSGGAMRCSGCSVRAFQAVVEAGLVPVCGSTASCPLGYHLLAESLDVGGRAECIHDCGLVVTEPAGSGS